MKDSSRRAISIFMTAVILMGLAVPVAVFVLDTTTAREFQGEAKLYEKPKPEGKPGKPPKDDDEGYPTPDHGVNKLAVVIGISDYRGRSNDLQYCDDDASDIYQYLLLRGYPETNVLLLLDKQATAGNIINAINWLDTNAELSTMTPECVFFYSGHGSRYPDSATGDETDEYDECIVSHDLYLILDDTLRDEFSTVTSDKFAIMFDSCHSGGMDELASNGRIVSAPCEENEYSWDGTPEEQNGVWTNYLLEGLYAYNTVEQAHNHAAGIAPGLVESRTYGEYTMTPVLEDWYPVYGEEGYWEFDVPLTT